MSPFIRLHVTAEGQTEEAFVRSSLAHELGSYQISTDVRSVLTSKDRARTYRGGLLSYAKAKADIMAWIKQDSGSDARFTTMFDFYALPDDFPGYGEAMALNDPYDKVVHLERCFAKDINDRRFIPYIQLHEFEALVFASLDHLPSVYIGQDEQIELLRTTLKKEFNNNPELVNDNRETAPSKRLIEHIAGNNKVIGAEIPSRSGMKRLRETCRHFGDWVSQLESLSQQID